MRKTCLAAVLIIFTGATYVLPGIGVSASGAIPPTLLISELQTTGSDIQGGDAGTKEFVELYNPSDMALTGAAGWRLEYLSASNDGSGAPTRVLGSIDVVVGAKSYLLFSYESYLSEADAYFGAGSASGWIAKSGGHLRIVDALGQTIDAVGWGSAVPLRDTPESRSWWHAPTIPPDTSIQRILYDESGYVGGLTFTAPGEPNPYGGNRPLSEEPGDEPEEPDAEPCQGIILTELLPNPSGADNGHEFLEIYNASDTPVSLGGCVLRLGTATSGETFPLPNEILMPGGYRAFYDDESGITLPNATPQLVWLTGTGQPLSVLYPSAMADDQVWIFFEGAWEKSNKPTPSAPNERSQLSVASSLPTLPGQKAKATTVAAAMAAACPAGKERNPATNRCRSTPAAAVPSPCKTGQERSPETNRCRSVLGAVTSPKPCPEGQERNPETNRCRKKTAAGAANIAQIQDVKSATSTTNFRWWVAGLIAVGAVGYAFYEWRRDIGNFLYILKTRYIPKK